MLMRRLARPLLATAFLVEGVDALTHPQVRSKAAAARVQQVQRVLPDQYAAKLSNPERLVQVNAAVQVGSALMLATGRFPRLAAALLAATVIPATVTEQDFWVEDDPDRRAAKRTAFLKDVSLLGGLMIAAGDTGGHSRRPLHTLAEGIAAQSTGLVAASRLHGAQLTEFAKDHGADVADVVKERGAELGGVVKVRGAELGEVVKERGADVADVVKERGGELGEVAKQRAAELAELVRDHGSQLVSTTQDRGAQLATAIRDRAAEHRE
ncbi:MAG: DoxX family protein [Nocardia sp.]|uniref:DoxX family membrane protein n=1 Tax=Nocardia sp. TaxID=1821 RepID=UPI002629592D|nr:DoxX family membrane protein [Nocardia sp.]MCU1642395.1 DoxX family protein [Nocardia sp.]